MRSCGGAHSPLARVMGTTNMTDALALPRLPTAGRSEAEMLRRKRRSIAATAQSAVILDEASDGSILETHAIACLVEYSGFIQGLDSETRAVALAFDPLALSFACMAPHPSGILLPIPPSDVMPEAAPPSTLLFLRHRQSSSR